MKRSTKNGSRSWNEILRLSFVHIGCCLKTLGIWTDKHMTHRLKYYLYIDWYRDALESANPYSRTWQMYCISILIAHFFSLILTLGMYEYHIGFSSLAYKRRILIKSFSNPSFHVYNSHSHSFYSQNYALKSKNTTKTSVSSIHMFWVIPF